MSEPVTGAQLGAGIPGSDEEWLSLAKNLARRVRFFIERTPFLVGFVDEDDIVHDSLLEFFESPTAFNRAHSTFFSYMAMICKRNLIDKARTSWRQLSLPSDLADPSIQTQDQTESIFLWNKISRVLPIGVERDLFSVLPEVAGRNVNQQLAEHLGISPSEVVNLKKRLHRIIRRKVTV